MIDKYKQVISYYGVFNQVRKLNEECFELTEAIIKYEEAKNNHFENYDDDDKKQALKNIVEEIGDVLNVVKQFIPYYNIDVNDVTESQEKKMDRQLERMKWEDTDF